MTITRLDHLVLTVADVEESVLFYTSVLGLEVYRSPEGRVSLLFGDQKINLHQAGNEFEPKAAFPAPGSGDLCLVTDSSLEEFMDRFQGLEVEIVAGPVERAGALGPMRSVYVRDPDGNLIEVARYP